jgi:hypothetical protein
MQFWSVINLVQTVRFQGVAAQGIFVYHEAVQRQIVPALFGVAQHVQYVTASASQ